MLLVKDGARVARLRLLLVEPQALQAGRPETARQLRQEDHGRDLGARPAPAASPAADARGAVP
jgi:hypothetical protein